MNGQFDGAEIAFSEVSLDFVESHSVAEFDIPGIQSV